MLYFGGGEGENIINNYNLGWVAQAGNYSDLNNVLTKIKITDLNTERKREIQKTAFKNFDFRAQIEKLLEIL